MYICCVTVVFAFVFLVFVEGPGSQSIHHPYPEIYKGFTLTDKQLASDMCLHYIVMFFVHGAIILSAAIHGVSLAKVTPSSRLRPPAHNSERHPQRHEQLRRRRSRLTASRRAPSRSNRILEPSPRMAYMAFEG